MPYILVLAYLYLLVTGWVEIARASGDANRISCGHASEVSPGFRSYLPDCRAYELASPVFREGGVLITQPAAISPDGNSLVFGLGGATAGAGNEFYVRGGDIGAYQVERGTSGWEYRALTPPTVPYEHSNLLGIGGDSGLSTKLWSAQTSTLANKEDFYLQTGAGTLREIGPGEIPALAESTIAESEELKFIGASSDLSHSLYAITNQMQFAGHVHDVWPGDTTRPEASSLYEYKYQGAADAEPTLVGVRNQAVLDGRPHLNEGAELISDCGTQLGSVPGGSGYNAVSEDGGTVFFTARACEGAPLANELYARIGGARTVAISEPSSEDCAICNTSVNVKPASFAGASADGQKAFFLSEQALLPGQEGMSLYSYDFAASPASPSDPTGRIGLVSPGPRPEVQGVVRISEDGSHVYFVAKGVLAGANAEGHAPQAGADNLYVSEPDPAHAGDSYVVFVATLLTPALEAEAREREETIEAEALAKAVEFWEDHCPPAFSQFSCFEEVEAVLERDERALGYFDIAETISEDQAVWAQEDQRPAQATPDGRFLVFVSSAVLTADDSSPIPQLFEYDAQGGSQGAGSLTRVSIGQSGTYDDDGNVSSFREAPRIPLQTFAFSDLPTAARLGLAVSDDGSRVFFTSAAPLTPLALSGKQSLFEYQDGNVYLISDGRDASATNKVPSVQLYGIDPSGHDVFFTTADQLVPQAADTQQALYDAREEGGFAPPSLAPGCLGETCRGSVGESPAPSLGGTISQIGEESSPEGPSTPSLVIRPPSKQTRVARAKLLARALRACDRLSARRRHGCRVRARRRYR